MPKTYPKERIDELARLLDIEPHEVLEMLADDERIDKGEKLFELNAEQEKASKKARQVSSGVQKTSTKREKKADNDKSTLIDAIVGSLSSLAEVTVVNPERELTLTYNDRNFKIVLSAPRS